MIKENEIKVGNWFQHNEKWCYRRDSHNSGNGKPFVFQWEARDWYALGECTLSLEDIEPIELTPEILEKCGFKYETKDKNHFVKDQGKQLYVSIYLGDGDYQPQICDDGIMSITLQPILYLHQLQNLYFALTGEELNYQP